MYIDILYKSQILVIDNYVNHKNLKDELVDILENYPDTQNRMTNVKATVTDNSITSPQIEILKKNILYQHKNSTLYANTMYPKYFEICNFWANIYRKGDYTIPHDHNPEFFSFVYFLKSKSYFSSLYFMSLKGKKKVRPKEGRLVIFPSFLVHGVAKHRYNETRITLSGDFNMRVE